LSTKPALRPLDFQPVIYEGEQMWFLRDPLRLTEYQLMMPPGMAQLLPLLDGTRDMATLHADFCTLAGETVPYTVVEQAITQLDKALLLENERSQAALAEELADYCRQPFRPPALAGISYPAGATELSDQLAAYTPSGNPNGQSLWTGRGIISPHIDYMRGGPVYGQVWQEAVGAVAAADLVLIFGTDHNSANNLITLTRQPYATPFGVLPAAPDIVEQLAAAYGPEAAFAEELNHRDEHSVELSAVWLHYWLQRLGREPCPVIPILCGSFAPFVLTGEHPAEYQPLNRLIAALRAVTAGRRVLAVASVDFAHVGPAFGDNFVMDAGRRDQLLAQDKSLLAAIAAGDHARFYAEIAGIEDRNRICGFSSIYTLLRYLEDPAETAPGGREVAYAQCPADAQNHSLVSICGYLLN